MSHAYGKSLLPATVGFDRLFSTMEELDKMLGTTKAPTYPPYNIVKFDNYNYEIQIAVAGFGQDDISVETNHNKLYVSGISEKSETDGEYLHHGLAKRDFKHIFTLSDTSVVNSADIKDGILKISIENVIPEEKRPRKIPIGIPQKTALLTEDKA